MRYEFEMIQTIVIDSDVLNVSNEEEARELIRQGFGSPTYWQGCEMRLVHVGHSASEMVECPEHGGGFDCTPFCKVCEGNQGYYPELQEVK